MSTYSSSFNRNFRLKIIALCLVEPGWFTRVGIHIIKPEFFEDDDEMAIVQAIHDFHTAYGKIPSDPDDMLVLCNGQYENTVYTVYDDLWDADMALVKDTAVQWAKEQAAKNAILESIDDVKKGDLQSVLRRIEAAVKVGDDLVSPGIDVIRDIDKWLYEQWVDKVQTGWIHMDILLDGGLGVGELGTILAPSNRGKSMALVNIAYGAATIGSGKNVVVFTHELHPKIYAKRIAARMTFRFPSRDEDLAKYEHDLTAIARKLMPGSIRIIGGTRMTTREMESSLDMLIAEGFEPDLLIDDYPDLVIPPTARNQRRFELSDIYMWYRDIAAKYEVPAWGASQVGRGAYDKEIIRMEDIAEDIGKVNISDIIVAICQTQDEAADERCRLFMAKVRDGKSGAMFDAKFYQDQQAIVSIGMTKRKDDKADA